VPTRREAFRLGASAAIAGIGLSTMSSGLAVAAPARAARGPHRLTRSRFAPLVGSKVRLTGPGGARDVLLTAAAATAPGAAGERRFSLRFEDHSGRPLPEGIYTVAHRRIGTVDLFLAPVGSASGRYEAVVNRLA
jgi:hypothetical protein